MKEALKLYYGQIMPKLRKDGRWSLLIVLWFVFHLGPLVGRSGKEPWEQPLIYANF